MQVSEKKSFYFTVLAACCTVVAVGSGAAAPVKGRASYLGAIAARVNSANADMHLITTQGLNPSMSLVGVI